MKKEEVNFSRYISGQRQGHYESFFMRANHPHLPQAFWIRYTIFSPNQHPENAIGELWAIYFDGLAHKSIAVKQEVKMDRCVFNNHAFDIHIGDSFLRSNELKGNAATTENNITWNLNFKGDAEPLFVLPENLYEGGFPKAKLLVAKPMAVFNGSLTVNGKNINIADWVGSQNHNWGSKHTDNYAWGQVAGFDNFPASFFEISTARLKMGPVWTPFFTIIALRHNGKEFRLNNLLQGLGAKGSFSNFNWDFYSKTSEATISGNIHAQKEDFTGLRYYNPPGGIKNCINTKIASCEIKVCYKQNDGHRKEEILQTANRAAFEILTEDKNNEILDFYL